MTDHKGPVDHAADYVFYAPLGFALEARRLLPSFVERGRQQVQMAKMIGRFAVQQGQEQAGKHLASAQEQAETILSELGLRVPSDGSAGLHTQRPPAAAPAVGGSTEPATPAPLQASDASVDLAIADYDSLAASQVIPRLAGLAPAELDAVRAYEAAHRGRKTILGKVAQLQGE